MQTTANGTLAGRAAKRANRGGLGRAATIVLFMSPALIVYILFVLYPIAQATWYSLYSWNGLGELEDNVGFDNYRRILTDGVFHMAIRHNLIILVLSLLVQLPLALAVALLIRDNIPGRTFFRTVFFLPYVLSEVITAIIWMFIFRPESGLANIVFGAFIPGYEPQGFLGNTDTVLIAIFAVITWRYFGFHMILYLAGLQGIPSDIEDAARVDGATRFQVLRDITIPLLGPTMRVSVFFSVLGSLQFFDLIWVMTRGGPVNASNTMATYMFTFGFQRFQLGYGAAVSLVIFFICFTFSVAYQRWVMRRDLEGAMT
ncbi:MAG TPA: sugar ABC transporter permease [Thermomicrobiales bacterium]|nr:sugar ABC transporter permease [Thermomicrobiales bacterium]